MTREIPFSFPSTDVTYDFSVRPLVILLIFSLLHIFEYSCNDWVRFAKAMELVSQLGVASE